MLGQPDGHDLQAVDLVEVSGIAGIDRKLVGQGSRRDERVVGARRSSPPRCPQRGSYLAESACRRPVEGQRVEVRLRFLQVCLPGRAFSLIPCHQGRGGEFGERSGCDKRFSWPR